MSERNTQRVRKASRPRHFGRRPSFALVLVLGFVPACAFWDVEHVPCLDDDSCVAAEGPGDGDGDSVGNGGNLVAAGGGSSAGGAAQVGGTSSGGSDTGGVGTGGSAGGTGGLPTGGTGGLPTGGTGGGSGLTEIEQLQLDLTINELKVGGGSYVEIYYAGRANSSRTLSDLHIIVDGNFANTCSIDGVAMSTAQPYLLVQIDSGACFEGAPLCVSGCNFPAIGFGDTVELRWGTGALSASEIVDSELLDSTSGGALESWQATEDGGDDFNVRYWTPGTSNN